MVTAGAYFDTDASDTDESSGIEVDIMQRAQGRWIRLAMGNQSPIMSRQKRPIAAALKDGISQANQPGLQDPRIAAYH